MSKYRVRPLEFAGVKTVPLQTRGGKVRVEDFGKPYKKGDSVIHFIDTLPRLLGADSFRSVIEAIVQARVKRKPILWGMGGHVVKCGLGPIFVDLIKRGFVSSIAMNGATAIHDFEIAAIGQTSEDVEAVLPDGKFGMAEETGREMNIAISDGNRFLLGIGEALGKHLEKGAHPNYAQLSLLREAYRYSIPVTVHVAIGTDTPHLYPKLDAAALGASSYRDFRLFCTMVKEMDEGGVYINVGSAVILPEVFLKAVSVVRGLGNPLTKFTTVNFDFLQQYRPKMNVVDRPHVKAGGKGFHITGHHEVMIPLLAAALIECEP